MIFSQCISCLICVSLLFSNTVKSQLSGDLENKQKYNPTWKSLESRPLPKWYDNDKLGIFIHWGVFSVPALGEWLWYNWKEHAYPNTVKFMNNNFKPNFTYQEFAVDFTATFFNATEWADLFQKSGARYMVFVSKHHEGYTMWPSKYSYSWNSVDVGPHRDIVGELAGAVRTHTNLRFGLYYSLFEWFNPLYKCDKQNNFSSSRFVEFKVLPELNELVEKYKPEIIWTDGEWEASDEYWKAKEFLSWLYNYSPVKDVVVVNDRWGSNTLCKHGGFLTCADRYEPGSLQDRKWEDCVSLDKKSWGYRKNADLEDYYTDEELIYLLVRTVSLGGNLLVNVGPTSDGKIIPIFQERLLNLGSWLLVNGESIYNTKPWNICQNDTVNSNVWYTTKFDNSTSNFTLFSIFLKWPTNNKVTMKCIKNVNSSKMELLGYNEELKWNITDDVTEVILPDKALIQTQWAWVIKITTI